MNIKIIQLRSMHLAECIDLDKKSLKGLWTQSQWKKELNDPNRICIGALDITTKKLLGLCSAWQVIDELHLTSLAVDPDHFRKGLGKFILSDLIKRSISLGINQIYLEVKDTNKPAIALYKSIGFKIKGQRDNFYKDGSNALIYIKELTKIKENPIKYGLPK